MPNSKLQMPNSTGFTLIEVLVSIAILGILAVVAFPNLKGFTQKISIQNVAKDIATQLKTAQANARTNLVCPDPTGKGETYPTDWDLVIWTPNLPATGGGYYLRAKCYNPTNGVGFGVDGPLPGGGNRGQEVNWPVSNSIPSNMTVTFNTCITTPNAAIGIDFTPTSAFNDCFNNSPPILMPFVINISDGTNTATVTIDSGGNITTK
jgi:prepilin-type N-terminal cleavage/methylation domain-containing protein